MTWLGLNNYWLSQHTAIKACNPVTDMRPCRHAHTGVRQQYYVNSQARLTSRGDTVVCAFFLVLAQFYVPFYVKKKKKKKGKFMCLLESECAKHAKRLKTHSQAIPVYNCWWLGARLELPQSCAKPMICVFSSEFWLFINTEMSQDHIQWCIWNPSSLHVAKTLFIPYIEFHGC